MDLNNLRGNKKGRRGPEDSSSRRPPRSRETEGDEMDMSPGAGYSGQQTGSPGARGQSGGPRSIQDTQAWQKSQIGLQNFWANYKRVLKTSWQRMSRSDQEALILRFCQIVTMGVSVLVLVFFYQFLPQLLRLLAPPVVGFGSFFVGTKIVAPIITAQYDQYLNKEF